MHTAQVVRINPAIHSAPKLKSRVCAKCGENQQELGHEPFCMPCHQKLMDCVVRYGISRATNAGRPDLLR